MKGILNGFGIIEFSSKCVIYLVFWLNISFVSISRCNNKYSFDTLTEWWKKSKNTKKQQHRIHWHWYQRHRTCCLSNDTPNVFFWYFQNYSFSMRVGSVCIYIFFFLSILRPFHDSFIKKNLVFITVANGYAVVVVVVWLLLLIKIS